MRPRRMRTLVLLSTIGAALVAVRATRAQNPPQKPAVIGHQVTAVPQLRGRPLKDTLLLTKARLTLGRLDSMPDTVASGTILRQSLEPGSPVAVGTPVDLTFAIPISPAILPFSAARIKDQGPVDSATVPDVRTGMSLVEATIILGIAGLDVGATHALTDEEHAGKVVRQAPEAGMRVPKHSKVELWYANEVRVAIPDVVGRSVDEARTAIDSARLKLGKVDDPEHTSGRGLVARQRPRAGANVNIGTTVQLRLGPLPEATVPPLVGRPLEDANGELTRAGLSLGSVDSTPSDSPPGTVLTQNPEAGAKVPQSSRVSLGVAAPRPDTVVPDVRGRTLAEATASIVGAGLQVAQRVESVQVKRDTGLVSAQQPAAGTRVRPGTEVALTVTVATPPPPPPLAMPLVTGWPEAKAIDQVRSVGLTRIALSRRKSPGKAGLVLEQSPAAGTPMRQTAPVRLVISVARTPSPPPAIVPDLAGRDEAEATRMLHSADLKLGTVTRMSGTDRGAKVIAQTPAPRAQAERGSAVSVTLALLVPDVVGLSADSAASLIARSYLTMTTSRIDGADSLVGLVLRQAPLGGTPFRGGERVQLWVGSSPGLGVPLAVLAVLALTAGGLALVNHPIPRPSPATPPDPPPPAPPPPAIGLHPHVGRGPRRARAEPSRLERLDLQLTPHLGDSIRSVETHEDLTQETS